MSMRPELSRDAAGDRIDAEAPVHAKGKHGAGDGSTKHLVRETQGPETGGAHERSPGGERGILRNVPATLRSLVEQMLALSRDGIIKAGARLFERGLGELASAAAVRTMISVEARLATCSFHDTKAVSERIAKLEDEDLVSAWGKATIQEREQATRIVDWQLQREYFEGYGGAAKQAKSRAHADLDRDPHSVDAQQRLRTAELAEEAATVLPVAGRLPRNHEHAGKQFPLELLPLKYREKGVKFTATGFPDFEPHAETLPSGKKYVEISYTRSRRGDSAEASAKAGYPRTPNGYPLTPKGYTWHHSEELGRMYLVPLDLHYQVKHTGGVAMYRHVTGDVKPYGS